VSNPLVADRPDVQPGTWAGVWIIEDLQTLEHGLTNGSWIDSSLGIVGASLDGLALASDPAGSLLQYGAAYLIEHIKPLSDALDWLAGDPAQITAQAQTLRNVAASLHANADSLATAVNTGIPDWRGPASNAYRSWAVDQRESINGLARAAETMATITEAAGFLIGAVRMLVRDAVATVVSRAVVYAAEVVFSFGLLIPLVIEQVSTLVAAWSARIAKWLHGLTASLRSLARIAGRVSELIEELKKILNRLRERVTTGPSKPGIQSLTDPAKEAKRLHDLGVDPAKGGHRPAETESAARVENERGVELERSKDPAVDWVDKDGKTYDSVGNFDAKHFDAQWPNLQTRILDHMKKADWVPVDVAKFTPEQAAKVKKFIADHKLGPQVFTIGG
jgi:uncharacterized protein YukE